MGVTIVTDSGSDLTKEEGARYGIEVVPVYLLFGGERLRDGIDIDRPTFYRRVRAGDVPTTEPAAQADFQSVFARIASTGNEVVALTLSSQTSKCWEHANEAAKAFPGKVHVVDTRGASGLETLLAIYAAELARAGKSASEVVTALRNAKTAAFFAVPNMNALAKSGRVPKAVIALGSMLGVSLVLKMNEQGVIAPGGQSRSFEKTCDIMVDAVVRAIERTPAAWVAISHVQAAPIAQTLSKTLAEKLGHPPIKEFIHESTLTIATNLGEGAVGIFAIVP